MAKPDLVFATLLKVHRVTKMKIGDRAVVELDVKESGPSVPQIVHRVKINSLEQSSVFTLIHVELIGPEKLIDSRLLELGEVFALVLRRID